MREIIIPLKVGNCKRQLVKLKGNRSEPSIGEAVSLVGWTIAFWWLVRRLAVAED